MVVGENAYVVILAGGGGTRLWPKSRQKLPKHLLKLVGDDTLLRLAYDRIAPVIPKERIFVITLKDHADLVKKQLFEIPDENIIIEPMQKNTALAMGTATVFIHKKNPDAVILNLAADHIYKDVKKFQETVLQALDVADQSADIVSIGIRPTYPHTGLGYIRVGNPLEIEGLTKKQTYVFKCKGFKEKPNLATAQSFVASGQYLWNANLYCWSTRTVLDAFRLHAPVLYHGLKKIMKAVGTKKEEEVLEKVYSGAESVQIDYAISEKISNLVVIPGDFGWSDIGDWKVVYDTLPKDSEGNVVLEQTGSFIGVDTTNSLIEVNGRLVVTVGVDNLVVVDTKDAILICSKDRSQDVKKAVEKLRLEKKDKYL